MEKRKLFLQLFTEGDDGGTGDGNGDGSGAEGGNNEPMSFDDFLAQEGNQAEFDRRVNKAIKTAVTKSEEKWKALTDDKLTEAEKLAKMTKEEKAEYRAKKAEKEPITNPVTETGRETAEITPHYQFVLMLFILNFKTKKSNL